jgi:hypothetical protein
MNALLNRRRLLQALGLGTSSLFLPSLGLRSRGDSSGGPPCRIAFVMTFHGVVYDEWMMRPGAAPSSGAFDEDISGLEASEFSEILRPLQPFADRMTVLDGLDLVTAKPQGNGIGHYVSPIHAMTAAPTVGDDAATRSTAVSIDQIIAEGIARPDRIRSVEVGLGAEPISYATPGQALPRETRTEAFWDRLFPGGAEPNNGPPTVAARVQDGQASMLDLVGQEYEALRPRLSGEDRQKLESHRDLIRDLEQRVSGYASVDCSAPPYPEDVLNSDPDRYNKLTKDFTDLVSVAFACDLTRVATIALTQLPNSAFGAPPGDVHQDFAHLCDPPDPDPVAYEQMTRYHRHHATQILDFLQTLDSVPEGNGSMLDNTLVVWLNEMADGTHNQDVYPMVLFGGSNIPLRFGRYIRFEMSGKAPLGSNYYNSQRPSGMPHNRVLATLAQAMGVGVDVVGESQIATDGGTIDCRGSLPELFI